MNKKSLMSQIKHNPNMESITFKINDQMSIELSENGFALWDTANANDWRWILDGSECAKNKQINLGTGAGEKNRLRADFNGNEGAIILRKNK